MVTIIVFLKAEEGTIWKHIIFLRVIMFIIYLHTKCRMARSSGSLSVITLPAKYRFRQTGTVFYISVLMNAAYFRRPIIYPISELCIKRRSNPRGSHVRHVGIWSNDGRKLGNADMGRSPAA
jgi:hypothetical protein